MICGNCGNHHHAVETVRRCHNGETTPCDWLIDTRTYDEDGQPIIVECGAASWVDERAWQCERGHEHVHTEVRLREGWDYASDEEEAAVRAKYGHESRLPDGHLYIPR